MKVLLIKMEKSLNIPTVKGNFLIKLFKFRKIILKNLDTFIDSKSYQVLNLLIKLNVLKINKQLNSKLENLKVIL